MKFALAVFLLLLVVFFGCVQKPEQPQQPSGAAPTFGEADDLETDLNDFSDLQNSLSDAALDDSGIDENSFS